MFALWLSNCKFTLGFVQFQPSIPGHPFETMVMRNWSFSTLVLQEGKVTSKLPSLYPEGVEPGPDILSVTSAVILYGALVVGVNV
jgi:hypothetical protein